MSTKQEVNDDLQAKTIYARCADKSTIRLEVGSPLKIADVKDSIVRRFKLHSNNFALFYEGTRICQIQEMDNVKDNAIIHVVDLSQAQKDQIKVYFKDLSSQKLVQVTVNPKEKIKSLFQKELEQKIGKKIQQVFLVHLGKALNVNSTFAQQFVQDQCEILIMDIKRKINLQSSFKTINHSYQIVKEQYQASIKLGMPYRESRNLADHDNSKKKQIQKVQKRQMNKHSMSVSLKKIQERSPENEEITPETTFKANLGLEEDMSYQISKLAQLRIEDQNLGEFQEQAPPLFKNKQA